ncbi:MAG: magnesium transporter [Rhodospirillales bacterium]
MTERIPDDRLTEDESDSDLIGDPFGLTPELEESVVEALDFSDVNRARELVLPLHPADIADLLEHLHADYRQMLLQALGDDLHPDTLSELDETVRDALVEDMPTEVLAEVVASMDTDDAVDFIEEWNEDEQRELLDALPATDRSLIEEAFTYPEDSAGRMMQRKVVTVPSFWTVGHTIDFLRDTADEDDNKLPEVFYNIFVVSPVHTPEGAITLSRLLRSKRSIRVTEIMNTQVTIVPVGMDQEEVAHLFRQRDLVSAPVVDASGRLVGAITVDDVVDVIHEEHEEDIMRLGGVAETDLYEAVIDTTKARFSWLVVNLATAIVASLVIGLFEATLEQVVALAVLMPIVASMGGNAGTQTLTVTVRALATKELTPTNAFRVMGKELMVGGINGLLFAVLAGVVAWVWFQNPLIGAVIATAMVINMIAAGFAGTAIPLLLERYRVDPAIASGVFLTTVTDVVGFAAFLGLAAWFVL